MCEAFLPSFKDLPDILPVFPLDGVLLLPRGQLPLNIFEKRYLQMVDDALRSNRLIGIIQPQDNAPQGLFTVGCVGRITQFQETDDGRYLITLTGVCRFTVLSEQAGTKLYRHMKVGYADFERDMEKVGCLNLDRGKLTKTLKQYFELQGMDADWDCVKKLGDEYLITALAMICPLSTPEKQALLEAPCCKERATLFMALLEMAALEIQRSEKSH